MRLSRSARSTRRDDVGPERDDSIPIDSRCAANHSSSSGGSIGSTTASMR